MTPENTFALLFSHIRDTGRSCGIDSRSRTRWELPDRFGGVFFAWSLNQGDTQCIGYRDYTAIAWEVQLHGTMFTFIRIDRDSFSALNLKDI